MTKSLYDQPINCLGSACTAINGRVGGRTISGPTYTVDGRVYMWPTEVTLWDGSYGGRSMPLGRFAGLPYDVSTSKFIREPGTRELLEVAIERQIAEDEQRNAARKEHALELAKGDVILAQAIKWNMCFREGDADQPWMVEGIPFYQVGRNSSHAFYAGVKGGQRYRIGKDYEDNSPPIVEAVNDWHGYYGHC